MLACITSDVWILVSIVTRVKMLQEACGFKTSGKRSQVYRLDSKAHGDVCLAATGEFPIAGKSTFI